MSLMVLDATNVQTTDDTQTFQVFSHPESVKPNRKIYTIKKKISSIPTIQPIGNNHTAQFSSSGCDDHAYASSRSDKATAEILAIELQNLKNAVQLHLSIIEKQAASIKSKDEQILNLKIENENLKIEHICDPIIMFSAMEKITSDSSAQTNKVETVSMQVGTSDLEVTIAERIKTRVPRQRKPKNQDSNKKKSLIKTNRNLNLTDNFVDPDNNLIRTNRNLKQKDNLGDPDNIINTSTRNLNSKDNLVGDRDMILHSNRNLNLDNLDEPNNIMQLVERGKKTRDDNFYEGKSRKTNIPYFVKNYDYWKVWDVIQPIGITNSYNKRNNFPVVTKASLKTRKIKKVNMESRKLQKSKTDLPKIASSTSVSNIDTPVIACTSSSMKIPEVASSSNMKPPAKKARKISIKPTSSSMKIPEVASSSNMEPPAKKARKISIKPSSSKRAIGPSKKARKDPPLETVEECEVLSVNHTLEELNIDCPCPWCEPDRNYIERLKPNSLLDPEDEIMIKNLIDLLKDVIKHDKFKEFFSLYHHFVEYMIEESDFKLHGLPRSITKIPQYKAMFATLSWYAGPYLTTDFKARFCQYLYVPHDLAESTDEKKLLVYMSVINDIIKITEPDNLSDDFQLIFSMQCYLWRYLYDQKPPSRFYNTKIPNKEVNSYRKKIWPYKNDQPPKCLPPQKVSDALLLQMAIEMPRFSRVEMKQPDQMSAEEKEKFKAEYLAGPILEDISQEKYQSRHSKYEVAEQRAIKADEEAVKKEVKRQKKLEETRLKQQQKKEEEELKKKRGKRGKRRAVSKIEKKSITKEPPKLPDPDGITHVEITHEVPVNAFGAPVVPLFKTYDYLSKYSEEVYCEWPKMTLAPDRVHEIQ